MTAALKVANRGSHGFRASIRAVVENLHVKAIARPVESGHRRENSPDQRTFIEGRYLDDDRRKFRVGRQWQIEQLALALEPGAPMADMLHPCARQFVAKHALRGQNDDQANIRQPAGDAEYFHPQNAIPVSAEFAALRQHPGSAERLVKRHGRARLSRCIKTQNTPLGK
jgi:hypothetical protein